MKNIVLVYKSTDNVSRLKKLADYLIQDNSEEDHSLMRLIIKENENIQNSIKKINDSTHVIINSSSNFGMPTKEINDFLYVLIENKITCSNKKVYFVIDGYYKSANQVINYLEYICTQLGFNLGDISSTFSFEDVIDESFNMNETETKIKVEDDFNISESTEIKGEEIIIIDEEIIDADIIEEEKSCEIENVIQNNNNGVFIEEIDPLLDEVYDEIEIDTEISKNNKDDKDIIYISMTEEVCKVDKVTGSVIPLVEGHGNIVRKNLKTDKYITYDIYVYKKAIKYFEAMKYLPIQYNDDKLECVILSSEIEKIKLPEEVEKNENREIIKEEVIKNNTFEYSSAANDEKDNSDEDDDEDIQSTKTGISGSIFGKAISKLKKKAVPDDVYSHYPKPITTQGEIIEIDDGEETTIVKSAIDVVKETEERQKQLEEEQNKKKNEKSNKPEKIMTEKEYVDSLPLITIPYNDKKIKVRFDKEKSIVILPDGKKMKVTFKE